MPSVEAIFDFIFRIIFTILVFYIFSKVVSYLRQRLEHELKFEEDFYELIKKRSFEYIKTRLIVKNPESYYVIFSHGTIVEITPEILLDIDVINFQYGWGTFQNYHKRKRNVNNNNNVDVTKIDEIQLNADVFTDYSLFESYPQLETYVRSAFKIICFNNLETLTMKSAYNEISCFNTHKQPSKQFPISWVFKCKSIDRNHIFTLCFTKKDNKAEALLEGIKSRTSDRLHPILLGIVDPDLNMYDVPN